MIQFLKSNYKILIGILIGLSISFTPGFNQIRASLEIFSVLLYFIVLLYYLNYTLMEFLIFVNLDLSFLKILEIKTNKNERSLRITMGNENLLEGEKLFKGIYNTIMNNEEFRSFGYRKIIILSCVLEDFKECNLHSNVLIDNDTSFADYYNEILNDLSGYNNLEYGYNNLNIIRYTVKVWNCSNLNNLNIKMTHSAITMVRNKESYNKFSTDRRNWLLNNRNYSTFPY